MRLRWCPLDVPFSRVAPQYGPEVAHMNRPDRGIARRRVQPGCLQELRSETQMTAWSG
ncbi:hypothetical protein MICRO8M_70325 [Microbacterium sp. 8M]|nr:hypothetical protein MICRO8M_70325 [Microbacterium sp. 8M]